MKNFILITVSFFLLTQISFAADSSDGCGLGNMINGKKTMTGISTRITTRAFVGIVDLGATTSGTLGCSKHSIVKNEKQQLHFVEANMNELIVDMAKGSGEYLTTFGRVLGCNDADIVIFSNDVKSNFEKYMEGQIAPQAILEKAREQIKNTSTPICIAG